MNHFKITELKPWQLKILSASLERKDTLVIQPTGSGKSLCYQLFPFASGKMTVVLTPTISLMKDQCCKLEEMGVPATFTGSSQTDVRINERIKNKDFKIIYSTPENFFNQGGKPSKVFEDLIDQGQIGLIAIDEAHLINAWKHFRYIILIIIYHIQLETLAEENMGNLVIFFTNPPKFHPLIACSLSKKKL